MKQKTLFWIYYFGGLYCGLIIELINAYIKNTAGIGILAYLLVMCLYELIILNKGQALR